MSCWEKLLEHENTIRRTVQQNIIDFAERFSDLYNRDDSIKNLVKFWKEMPLSAPLHDIFNSIFN